MKKPFVFYVPYYEFLYEDETFADAVASTLKIMKVGFLRSCWILAFISLFLKNNPDFINKNRLYKVSIYGTWNLFGLATLYIKTV